MKIAVFGYPGTGSTKLCRVLEKIHNVPFVGEIFTQRLTTESRVGAVFNLKHTPCVVKYFSYQFSDFPLRGVDWTQYDQIYFTCRNSIVDAFITSQVRNRNLTSGFTVNSSLFLDFYQEHILTFEKISDAIRECTCATIVPVTYDEILDDSTLSLKLGYPVPLIESVDLEIDFRVKCLNYAAVEQVAQNVCFYPISNV